MHRFNFPRLAAVLLTAIVVFAACAQGPGTAGPRGPSDTAPAFAVTVADQTYTEGEAVSPLTLPVASGGNGTLSYSLAPTVPGLTFTAANGTSVSIEADRIHTLDDRTDFLNRGGRKEPWRDGCYGLRSYVRPACSRGADQLVANGAVPVRPR